jgi:hypothetical protein
VLDAFTSGRPASSKKLHSDGKVLDGLWMGGNKIAEWKNGKVVIRQITSRSEQTVARALKKMTPKKLLAAATRSAATYNKRKVQFPKPYTQDHLRDILIDIQMRLAGTQDFVRMVKSLDKEEQRGFDKLSQSILYKIQDLYEDLEEPEDVEGAAESGDQDAYKRYFEQKLKKWNVKSPDDLSEEDKPKFFEEVDKGWTSQQEKGAAADLRGASDVKLHKQIIAAFKAAAAASPRAIQAKIGKDWKAGTPQKVKCDSVGTEYFHCGMWLRAERTDGVKVTYFRLDLSTVLDEYSIEASQVGDPEEGRGRNERADYDSGFMEGPDVMKMLKSPNRIWKWVKPLPPPEKQGTKEAGPWNKALVLQKFPSGKWGFVGSVPMDLYLERKEGKPIPPEDAKHMAQTSNPAMFAKTKGMRQRVFKSKEEALAAAKKLKAKVTQVSEGAKQAQKPKPKKLTPSIRNKIAKDLKKVGLDGNGRFRKPEEGYSKAVDVLGKYGIELDGIPDSHRFKGDKGSVTVDLAWSNKEDPFSPVSMNSMLAVSFYKLEDNRFEVLAYIT